MNIEALSKELGKSYKTVYRKIAAAGLVLQDLKDEEGQLTPEGIQAISALFDKVGQVENRELENNDNEKLEKRIKALSNGIGTSKDKALIEARADLERLKGALMVAETRAEAAERERDLYKQMAEKAEANALQWKEQAERAQQLQTMQLQLLPQRAGVRGFFSKLFGGKDATKDGQQF